MDEAAALTADRFLGGRLELLQPETGYRAGIDPVLLAASVSAQAGDHVLELGCGVGTVLACLATRIPGLVLTGLERQAAYAALARRNGQRNGLTFEIIDGDIGAMPAALKARNFDHVVMNPPYWEAGSRTPATDLGREAALSGVGCTELWCDAALRRLKPGGLMCMIQPAEALPAVTAALAGRASITIRPLAPRAGRAAMRIIVQARKGGRAPCVLAAPQILHEGKHHGDGCGYAPAVERILRDGAAWTWGED